MADKKELESTSLKELNRQDVVPVNFALKFVDANINRAVSIEPNQATIILLDLKKNVVTQVR